jgi:hypothetical protein
MSRNKPTLVVFTLGAVLESGRRRLLPSRLEGMEIGLRQTCLEMVLDAGQSCGLRVEVCSPTPLPLPLGVRHVLQRGEGFGDRLERALQGAFDRAGSPVVVVGTDVPNLAARHLVEALGLLAGSPDRVVVGPSPDGGFYLLAAARPIPGLAAAARWCRRDALVSLCRSLAEAGREVVLLEPLVDLDRPASLDVWLTTAGARGERWRMVVTLLARVLAERRRPLPAPATPALPRPLPGVFGGRAPPADLFH